MSGIKDNIRATLKRLLPPSRLRELPLENPNLSPRIEKVAFADSDLQHLLEEVVSLYDELAILKSSPQSDNKLQCDFLRSRLKDMVERVGAELIDDDNWDAARQRAIEIRNKNEKSTTPTIAEKVGSGLRFRGRLIKKQEVILNTKPEN